MKLELFIGLNYLRAKSKRKNLISFAAITAIGGVFFGVLVPIVVMSVLNGFQNELKVKILGLQSHVTVYGNGGLLPNYEEAVAICKEIPGVVSVSPVITIQGIANIRGQHKPVVLKGVEPNIFNEDSELKKIFQFPIGSNDLSRNYFLLAGTELQKFYFLQTNERISVVTLNTAKSFSPQPIIIPLELKGFFRTGYYDHDKQMMYTTLETLQKRLNMVSNVSQLEIKVSDIWKAGAISSEIRYRLNNRYSVYSWKELNANTFQALQTERILLWIVVIFILVVAVFNVLSSQIMLVIEKRKEVGILKTMGMQPKHILKIFLFEGAITTIAGAVPGVIFGHLFSLYLEKILFIIEQIINFGNTLVWHLGTLIGNPNVRPALFEFFPRDIYYFDKLPVDINVERELIIFIFAVVLSLVAGIIPARKAASLKPVEVLRYE